MQNYRKLNKNSFTTIELILVFVIIAILTAISSNSLLNVRHQTSLSSTISALINDLKEEQYSAMVEGVERTVRFDSHNYQLGEFTISLDSNLEITDVTFPEDKIVFASLSGEIKNFVAGQNTIVIQNIAESNAKIINLNRFGVITSIL